MFQYTYQIHWALVANLLQLDENKPIQIQHREIKQNCVRKHIFELYNLNSETLWESYLAHQQNPKPSRNPAECYICGGHAIYSCLQPIVEQWY